MKKSLYNHFIPFDFRPDSPQRVSMVSTHTGIMPDRADALSVSENECRVGFFTDEMPQNIITRVVNFKLDVVALCGHESTTLIGNLRSTIDPDIHKGLKIWKIVDTTDWRDVEAASCYDGCIDAFVFCIDRCQAKEELLEAFSGYHAGVPFMVSTQTSADAILLADSFAHEQCVAFGNLMPSLT